MATIEDYRGGGSYGEGTIANVINYLKPLKKDFESGKLSQADYIAKLSEVVPQTSEFAHGLMASGQSKGRSAEAAGAAQLFDFEKDFNIYSSSKELLGRDITPQEYAQFKPRFADNADTGRAYLAEISKQEANSPKSLEKKAPEYSGQVNKTFQDLLSRGATQEEADYFGRMLATGQVTPYEVNNFVQALPEYQTKQDTSFRKGLEGELAGYDEKAFGRERENILSQYTRAGLQNSSALDFAMTDALGKIQEQRGQFLGGLSSQQYGGNKDAARRDYEGMLNNYSSNQNYARGRGDQYLDYLSQRADQGADYTRQRDDYMRFLTSQPQQGGGMGVAGGALSGAAAGSAFGPWGALIGGVAGGGLSYLNR